MNERIQALALQCYKTDPLCRDGWPSNTFDEQKFAQLIVRECIDTAFHRGHPDLEFLLRHFGVEL